MKKPFLKTLRKPGSTTKRLFNFKVGKKDMCKIKKNADRYALGNVSEWVRYAAMNFHPTDEDLTNPHVD